MSIEHNYEVIVSRNSNCKGALRSPDLNIQIEVATPLIEKLTQSPEHLPDSKNLQDPF